MINVADEAVGFPFRRVSNAAIVVTAAFVALALRRWQTFHNETFDLAFYARIVWGLGRGDLYQPLTESYFWGLHASPILFVLGAAGRVLPIVPMLFVLQAASVTAAGIPLARIASRRVGVTGAAEIAFAVWVLYPTVSTTTTYEFHPGSLALFPLAQALDYFDARRIRPGLLCLLLAATCREDSALVAGFAGLSLAFSRRYRWVGLGTFVAGVLWFAIYFFVIAPRRLPQHGSLQLHFGHLGGGPSQLVRHLVQHPIAALRASMSPAKALYLPRLLAPLAFLSLLAPRWLLPIVPVLAINLLSNFPTAIQVGSHYSLLALPFVFASAAHGAARLVANTGAHGIRVLRLATVVLALATLHAHRGSGATPLSVRFRASAFRRDARRADLPRLLVRIRPGAHVAAPDYVLAHVFDRSLIQRIPWRRGVEYILLPIEYRDRFADDQGLWRSEEEILTRNTLAGRRYGLIATASRHLLFERGANVRAFARGRYIRVPNTDAVVRQHQDVGPSLSLAGFSIAAAPGGALVTLLLVARQAWPLDLGLEIGWGRLQPHADRQDPAHVISFLPFDGLFSPVHVEVGEVSRSQVFVPTNPEHLVSEGLYFGARRIDGSRLDAQSAHWTRLNTESWSTPIGAP